MAHASKRLSHHCSGSVENPDQERVLLLPSVKIYSVLIIECFNLIFGISQWDKSVRNYTWWIRLTWSEIIITPQIRSNWLILKIEFDDWQWCGNRFDVCIMNDITSQMQHELYHHIWLIYIWNFYTNRVYIQWAYLTYSSCEVPTRVWSKFSGDQVQLIINKLWGYNT